MTALLLAAALAAAGGALKPQGDGALRLLPEALKQAREKWGEELCLAGLTLEVERFVKPDGPGARPGRITTFQFHFLAPDTGARHEAFYTEAEGPAPFDPAGSACVLDAYGEFRTGSSKTGCVEDFSIDSHEALGIGVRHGINQQRHPGTLLDLRRVDRDSGLWAFTRLRNKTVWLVYDGKTTLFKTSQRRMVILDAADGRVLEKGENAVLNEGRSGAMTLRYPHLSVGRNACSADSW